MTKNSYTENVQTMLTTDMRDELREIANDHGMTLSTMVRTIIIEFLEKSA